MKKVLIISHFFYPEITPRAFRTTELVKGFCKKGWSVDLIVPNKKVYKEKKVILNNFNLIYADEPEKQHNSKDNKVTNKVSKARAALKRIVFYFFPPEIFLYYNKGITQRLKQINKNYDKIISISHPLSIHLSLAIASITNKKIKKAQKIAEFSDPPFKGNYKSVLFTNYIFIIWFTKLFDLFVVPVKEAVPKFKCFKDITKIRVIPQGVFFEEFKTCPYKKNRIPHFSYAGSFYKELRDPSYFFEFLKGIDNEFRFDLYLPQENYFKPKILDYANQIKGEIRIFDFLPRQELISVLSKNDFLINFDNENASMSPSKLIDYAITKRPILSFNKGSFDGDVFKAFLEYDFTHQIHIDVNKYDMNHITDNFIEL